MSDSKKLPICTNCKHHELLSVSILRTEYGCGVENLVDLVTGEKVYRRCSFMRQQGKLCGLEGLKFEPLS